MDGKEIQLPLGINEIKKCIPHRYPFLLVDKITSLEPGKSVVGVKNISISDPILQGHFPEFPVFPGVLMIEGMAQTSAILGYYSVPEPYKEVLLTEVSQSRFKRMVLPGDQLKYDVTLEKSRAPFFWFRGKVFVDDQLAASISFSAQLK